VATTYDGKVVDFCPGHAKAAQLPHAWCPACRVATWNPNDVANRYCGRCRRFYDDFVLPPAEVSPKTDDHPF
jgi:hypothetical protein